MKRQLNFLVLLIFLSGTLYAQNGIELKLIPDFSMKIGSQQPSIGFESCISAGVLFGETYYAGICGGYSGNMGLGGRTFPLCIDGRIFFSLSDVIQFMGFSPTHNMPMQFSIKQGMSINTNDPYKTGYIFSSGLAYRLDLMKINGKSFLPFYAGFEVEYNRTGFYDEYRSYAVTDGYISQLFLHLKISFDFNPIKL